ncbi:PREDICTED: FT-interacting protein 1 [Tarenaya hassleriana]|uniref:FT-interacting protein 1 n=1 Tax=Tarenaya hassleriana TaxID=28532 RepID=UPI00053C699B|nr:PREDICTED: FT-interacting protein 1 [Tarenaya hassleriana]XP_010557780.1 PREDICTED: FT-interacting protein 1 [Tarenaya hassleriana]XP_010557782.1 PREDICTED: FT-interacting protein 1 [Tarenaya hassleriana]XP_010557783.1 PREDICTED: FT-interacting protein 1 [Tarenaya hassleriana]
MRKNTKLVVEVVDAQNLMPRDGEGSASPFVEVDFLNQLSRTRTIPKTLHPVWNQTLSFDYDQTRDYSHHSIQVSVYHERRPVPGRSFLGRVRVSCSNFVKKGEEVYQRFPLEKKWLFSSAKGEIGLKLYVSPQEPDQSTKENTPLDIKTFSAVGSEAEDSEEDSFKDTASVEDEVLADFATESAKGEEDSEGRKEAVQALHKQEVLPQPATMHSIRLRSRVPTTRMHPHDTNLQSRDADRFYARDANLIHRDANHPPSGETDPEAYEVKDMSPELGERWPNPNAGGGWMNGRERFTTSHDLVEQMFYLYVRVVRAKDLPPGLMTGGCDPYVEVKLGNYKGRTKHFDRKATPEWNQVFAFSKERIQSSVLEVFVKGKETLGRDDYLGRVMFDLNEIPKRVPPDSPLAPQWYRLEDRRGEGKVRGEIMLAVWMGTQADEAFSEAWHADSASVYGEGVFNVRSKVYVSPKLWYLRVNIIEAQDVIPNDKNRLPDVFVKANVGTQTLKTKICPIKTINPLWNEDLVFVVAEPFEEQLLITIEDNVHPSKDEVLGKISLPMNIFEKRLDHRPVQSRWFNLEKYGFGALEPDRRKELKFSSRIHLRVCLEGGYHVMDESTMYISDTRPTARQLWKQPVGILEVGILGAKGLLPMKVKDGRGSTDAYCVAKYGQKWVRTRTILDTLSPRWNEQYTWEVYDPCTVITLGVFDNCHLGSSQTGNGASRDARIGKVRIRLSTLEAHKIYTHSFPLLVLQPHGLKKTGEVQISIRFTTLSLANIVYIYSHSLLPKMHYLHPFTINQVDSLRYQAMNIVATRLGRAEPPLRKEIVEYMLDVDSHLWSMRRSKANFFRIMSLLSGSISVGNWLRDVCNWRNPVTSILVHVLFLILVMYPELILPTMLLYMFFIGLWNFRTRPRYPPHMDTKLSWAEAIGPDELDEEFDTFPTSRSPDLVRMRYDRLRSVAGRIQTVVGDIATQGERIQSLLSWRDPRATSLFILFCLSGSVILYATPFRVVALVGGLYYLRHPKFRSKLPCVPSNFFKRLPTRSDSLL